MSDKRVIVNANVITMDVSDRRCRAIAIEGDRIVRLGSAADVKDLIEQGWPVEDFGGRTVLPGFIDTHEHLMLTGSLETAVQLDDVTHTEEILERIAERAASTEKGGWVRGSFLNEQNLAQKAMPAREALDRAVPDHPVYIMHATCHMASLNSRALEIVQPPLTLDGLDLKGGKPTGVVRDPGILTCVHPAIARIMLEEEKAGFLIKAAEMALKKGITTLHALDGGELGPGDTKVICNNRDRLPLHVVCYNQSMDLDEVKELGLPRVGGCICSDGAFEAHTAALFEPYADEPDNYGALTYTQEAMDRFIMAAHREGLQIAVHCESDRSIEQVLWAMEKALRAFPREDHRHRIEHFELPTTNQIERMAKAGIMASMQPAFIPAFIGREDMAVYGVLLGKPRLKRVHPYRTILDAGIPISGGSDSPVTPYNPLKGIQAAVNHPNPQERISVKEALAMFTTTAAWSAFEDNEKGRLEAGKLADLVVLERDLYDGPTHEIQDIGIHSVSVGGKWHSVNS
ncbi:amidohydrolase [Desulfosarcina sp.]|uniref:amidohydrolase n=1 Tax=Desulfosarcina sp. TaxID=2027861 RepID=UPI00397098FD